MNAEVAGVEVATDVVLATGEVTAGQSSGDGITRLAGIAESCRYSDVRLPGRLGRSRAEIRDAPETHNTSFAAF